MASPLPPPSLSPKPPSSTKPPPLPWSHPETLALIQAYQEKWYSLKKGQLKAFQWEEVAVTVAARCGYDEPTKTATQCRHKIEKLRKRYRSELQKPYYPNTWQYFELMDLMERGPGAAINARPIAAVARSKSPPSRGGSGSNNGVFDVKSSYNSGGSGSGSGLNLNPRYGYGGVYAGSAENHQHYRGRPREDNSEGSDESEEEWNGGSGAGGGYGVEAVRRSKSRSINNIVREDIRGTKRVAVEGSARGIGVCMNQMNGKRKQFYAGNDSVDDEEQEEEDDEDGEETKGEGDGEGREVAAEIKGFMERFMRMENRKIEMMRAMEIHRLEMEKKRMEMIREAQRKMVDTIGRAFGAHKKPKMET